MNKITAALRASLSNLQQDQQITVIVALRQRADLSRISGNNRVVRRQNVIRVLKTNANASQGPLRALLQARLNQGRVHKFASLWITNAFSVTATADVISELAQHPDVSSISPDDLGIVPAYATPEINISNINANALWNLGYTGQGIVIANLDTGVDVNHLDLSTRWRGGSNSWFDPYGEHPTAPIDLSGHGTWTMGVMVGGDAGGTTIGVAPDAQWIAARIFNDSGVSTATAIHQALQWLLDPDGNPNTDDAPDVVNNSWTSSIAGCTLDFEPDLQALRAADILPVFAAGNYGPSSNTSRSPANNPSAFPVGNLNDNNAIYSTSSRGPSSCAGWTGPYPRIVAPGVTIRTSDLFGAYYDPTGTSLSAPHVTGGLALLLSAYPSLSAVEQENALISSAVDLGLLGPDNSYGYGRLDLLAAFNLVAANATSTPEPATFTPTGTATVDPAITPTDTPVPPTTTSTPTDTLVPPTATFTPTDTPVPPTSTFTPTDTDIPPTATATFTPTATATSTPTFTATVPADLIFQDGFENGNLAAWTTSATDNGSLSVNAAASLIGALGLSANLNDNISIYMQDDLPAAETRYRARFYFDPNTITMSNGNAHYLLSGYSGNTTVVTRLEFRRSSNVYQIRAQLVNDASTWTSTGWFTISDAPHYIEIDWRAASGAGANNGGLTLWTDGTQRANLTGVDNDTRRIDRLRLGAVAGVDTGTRGIEYFDTFESRRLTYIGADISSPTPTSTVTFTASPTSTPAATLTNTATATPTFTGTPAVTFTASATPTVTATYTSTPVVPTNTPSVTPTFTNTPTASVTPSQTAIPTGTFTPVSPTATWTSAATFTPTFTSPPPTATFTSTATRTSTATPTGTASVTPSPTATWTSAATFTPTSTATRTPTATPTRTASPTSTATSASGFPSASVLDNFNRANGTPGPNWGGATSGYSIVSNRLDVGNGDAIFWKAASFGASQEVFVTLTTVDTAGFYQDLMLKAQSATSWGNGVIDISYDAAGQRVQVWTYSDAQGWVQRGADIPVTFVNGDQFGARAKADGTVEIYRNGTLIGSCNVSAWTYSANGGYIGIWFQDAGAAVVDDFGGGTITP